MGIIKNGAPNTLQLFALDQAGVPITQTSPWPKVSISRVSAPAAVIVADASMTIEAAGEFTYAWTPAVVGQYRVKYEMKNGLVSVFAYEDLDSQDIAAGVGVTVIGEPLVGTIPLGDTIGLMDSEVELIGIADNC